jgi:hypothetical protein
VRHISLKEDQIITNTISGEKKTKKPHQGDTLWRRFEATKDPNPVSFVGRQIATACTGYSCSLI